jgi:hypothetical protein
MGLSAFSAARSGAEGMRRDRPHPGARPDLTKQRDGYRHPGPATETRAG